MNNITDSVNKFSANQKRLHETICNPNTSNLQSAIDSKRELDSQNRVKELEKQNIDLVNRLKKNQKYQVWISILCTIIGAGITELLEIFLQ